MIALYCVPGFRWTNDDMSRVLRLQRSLAAIGSEHRLDEALQLPSWNARRGFVAKLRSQVPRKRGPRDLRKKRKELRDRERKFVAAHRDFKLPDGYLDEVATPRPPRDGKEFHDDLERFDQFLKRRDWERDERTVPREALVLARAYAVYGSDGLRIPALVAAFADGD